MSLLGFPVQRMLAAARAVLFQFNSFGVVSLVLRAAVIALLALGTGQMYGYAHFSPPSVNINLPQLGPPCQQKGKLTAQ
jgi:hypothetical protein